MVILSHPTVPFMTIAAILKTGVKQCGMHMAPGLTLTVLSIRSRRLIERQAAALGLVDLALQISAMSGSLVQAGPFNGMHLDFNAFPAHTAPKLLGSYESELHGALETAIDRRPALVINIGSAEGYYAVGLARRLPHALVVACDADPKARRATFRNAALNGVGDRVEVIGAVTRRRLERLRTRARGGRILVVSDCEGAEVDLLDPAGVPMLRRADVLVELHPRVRSDVEQELRCRFRTTHDCRTLDPDGLAAKLTMAPPWLDEPARRLAVDERRGRQSWLLLLTKQDTDQAGLGLRQASGL